MNGQMHATTQTDAEKHARITNVIWLAFIATCFAFFLVTQLAAPPEVGEGADEGAATPATVLYALLAAGLSSIVLSFVVKSSMLKSAIGARRIAGVQTAYIVAFVLCEVGYLIGMVARFVTLTNYHYALFALGGLALLLHKPRREHFEQAAGTQKF